MRDTDDGHTVIGGKFRKRGQYTANVRIIVAVNVAHVGADRVNND